MSQFPSNDPNQPPPGYGEQSSMLPPPPIYGNPQNMYPPPMYGAYPPPYGAIPQPEGVNGLAIASLVLGIIGLLSSWTVCLSVLPIVGVILGHIGYGKQTGRGMALAGLILGYVAIAISIFIILFIILRGSVYTNVGTTTP